ncbi:uncharacterized protein PG986_006969 [Apiospora aurea]|uniref:Uncharacterized protein n=1 Tax=Apiospora aurea TaxID=335848 RepID=A0ABR1QBY6_9PEZI
MAPPPLKAVPSSLSATAKPSVPIHPLEGVVVDGMPGWSLHSVCLQEEGLGEKDVVEIRLGSPSPPLMLRGDLPGDQSRPRFIIIQSSNDEYYEEEEEEEEEDWDGRSMHCSANLDAPSRDERAGLPTSSSNKDQAGVGGDRYLGITEEEREWRAKEAREKVAHEVRVTTAERCLHPQPKPIAQYSGPMTVVRLDRMAALMKLQTRKDVEEEEEEEEENPEKEGDIVQPLKEYAGLADWAQVLPREQCLFMEAEVVTPKRREGKETVREHCLRGEETVAQVAAPRWGERRCVTTPPGPVARRRSDELSMPLRFARVRAFDESLWIR